MYRRIICLLLSILLLLSLFSTTIAAANSAGLKFEIEDDEATLVFGSTASGALTIPESYKGYPVTAIGNSALLNCTELTSVVIPDCVTSVGSHAFRGCTKLTSVTIGSGVTYLDNSAFSSCSALKTVSFSDSSNLEVIWQNVFQDCTALTTIRLPDSVRYIANYAFSGCKKLNSLVLPASLEWIGTYAFQKCKALTQLTLPESLRRIELGAFQGCSALKELQLSRALTFLGADAFSGTAVSLEKVLPASMHEEMDGAYVSGDDIVHDCVINYDYAAEVLELINKERAAAGLDPVSYNETLASHAQQRAAEIDVLFAHDRPNGRGFVDCLLSISAGFGENIAGGFISPEDVMEGWMNSPGHRSNILDSKWTSVGIGCYYYDGSYRWVQIFSDMEPSGTASTGVVQATSCVTVSTDAFSVATQQLEYAYLNRDLATPYYVSKPDELHRQVGDLCRPDVLFWHKDDAFLAPEDMVQWESADPTIARCTEEGIVCLHSGTTTLTATFGSLVQTFTLEVSSASVPEDCDGGPLCPGFQFLDMPAASYWSHQGIDFALANGLFQGVSSTMFEPETPMTRAMLVTVLWRLAGEPACGADNPYVDVRYDFWYTEPIIWAFENNIVNGVGHGYFEPDESITREQLATILYRYANYIGCEEFIYVDLGSYPDCTSIKSWAYDAFSWANATGLITGTTFPGSSERWLDPQGNATRAQVATILMRFVLELDY